ncbi:hypothetical protein P171DRAFT_428791 [Karstenula rhodostoma CBS 690.94]|uniref:BZIP domain-containing protein n=1 Tax=Karstenula rhodostoma CBS 690.94 TaxID=1392251 RepID=A0A9P4PT33_9PLEO|nr:hypothetical protein P171DRAFT_428791 [Karstenula rhodostoma CBS 690.94]
MAPQHLPHAHAHAHAHASADGAGASASAIVPTPTSAGFTPITSTAASPTGASPLGAGPTGRSYVVPPRPKPGRKPATDEPASKRKAQNRESQRAFRARKAAKLTEMQEHTDVMNRQHREEINEMLAEQHRLSLEVNNIQAQLDEARAALQHITKERDYWKDHSSQTEAQHNTLQQRLREQNYPLNPYSDQQAVFFPQQSSPTRSSMGSFSGYSSPKSMTHIGCGNCKPGGDCACIAEFSQAPNPFAGPVPVIHPPPRTGASPMKGVQFQVADPFADREIDFTTQFSKRGRVEQHQSVSLLAQSSNEPDSKCGFCTDESNCLCRNQTLQFQNVPHMDDGISLLGGVKTTGPGSCDACQSNPKQRAWCQRVAQLKKEEFQPPASSRNSSISSTLETMEPHIPDASTPYGAKQTLGCNEAFKLFDGRVSMDQDKLDWIGNLRRVPPQGRRDTMMHQSRQYSAVELDTAGIIATLGNSMKPLQPRKEDGENSDIVRMAQEFQRNTQSPHRSPGFRS